jgi:hypothetical protein
MDSILAKVNVLFPLIIGIVFFLNTYNTIAIATSWSVTPIATTSDLIPLNIALATSKTSLLTHTRHLSFHLQDVTLSTSKTSLFPPPRDCVAPIETMSEPILLNVTLDTSKTSLLPPPRHHSFHLQEVSLATSNMSLFPPPTCLSCHLQDVALATSKTSVLRWIYGVWIVKSEMTRVCMKRRNKEKIYVIGKATSCETTFEGVHCLSFSKQYKVAITSNVSSKFDPNVLVKLRSYMFLKIESILEMKCFMNVKLGFFT